MGGQSKLVKLLDHTVATQAKAGIVDVTEKLRGARVVLEGAGVLFRTMAELVGKRSAGASGSMAASIAAHVVNNAPVDAGYIHQVASVAAGKVAAIAAVAGSVTVVLEGPFPLKAPEQAARAESRKAKYAALACCYAQDKI